jgi:hypothetical protein
MSASEAFQLLAKKWYAMEVFGAGGAPTNPHLSPIYVNAIEPLKTGHGILRLTFFHANYPEGVQNKEYVLRVLHRGTFHLAAVKTENEDQPLVIIFPLESDWIQTHFPKFESSKYPMSG